MGRARWFPINGEDHVFDGDRVLRSLSGAARKGDRGPGRRHPPLRDRACRAGPCPPRGSAGNRQDAAGQVDREGFDAGLRARAVHSRPDAGRHRRHLRLRPHHAHIRAASRTHLHQRPACRRDQPRSSQGPVRAARGDGGARCDPGGPAAGAARPFLCDGDSEPDRIRRHVPATRSPAGPISFQGAARRSDAGQRARRRGKPGRPAALNVIRGLAPQPRLIWAAAIGAGLIALAVASPVLGLVAIVFNAGLAIIAGRDLALLPGRSGYTFGRTTPEPFSLGEPEEVTVVVQNRSASGLMARVADHAPAGLRAEPREVSGKFDESGRLTLSYRTYSPKRGAYRFGSIDLQVWREGGWW